MGRFDAVLQPTDLILHRHLLYVKKKATTETSVSMHGRTDIGTCGRIFPLSLSSSTPHAAHSRSSAFVCCLLLGRTMMNDDNDGDDEDRCQVDIEEPNTLYS